MSANARHRTCLPGAKREYQSLVLYGMKALFRIEALGPAFLVLLACSVQSFGPFLLITNAQPSDAGSYSVLVKSGAENVASRAAGLQVMNTPPKISPIGDVSIRRNILSGPIPFAVWDAETPPAELLVSVTSSNTGLIPNGNIFFDCSPTGTNRVMFLRPNPDGFGETAITITVTDGAGATASATFRVEVRFCEQPPTISSISNQVTYSGDPYVADHILHRRLQLSARRFNALGKRCRHQFGPCCKARFERDWQAALSRYHSCWHAFRHNVDPGHRL
jgi:hypothetical protein